MCIFIIYSLYCAGLRVLQMAAHTAEVDSTVRYLLQPGDDNAAFALFHRGRELKTVHHGKQFIPNQMLYNEREINSISELLLISDEKSCLVVSGSPGIGKSFVILNFLNDFQNPSLGSFSFDIVLRFDLSDEYLCENVDNWSDLDKYESAIEVQKLTHSRGNEVLIIFENFSDKHLKPNSLIKKILKGDYLPDARILVSTRPNFIDSLKSLIKVKFNGVLTVQGFSAEGIIQYFQNNSKFFKQILSYLTENNILEMCSNPSISSIVCKMFDGKKFETPKSLSKFLYEVLTGIISREIDSDEKQLNIKLEDLPDSVRAAFRILCDFAKQHLVTGEKCTDDVELMQFLSVCELEAATPFQEAYKFSVLSVDQKKGYKFVCPVMVEFLLAFHLYQQPPLNQLYFLYKNSLPLFLSGFKLWLKFFFGLVGAEYVAHIKLYPTKLMLNSVVDVLVDSLKLTSNDEYRYDFLACVYEAQEDSLVRKMSAKHPGVLNFHVPISNFESSISLVKTLITKSGIKKWIITCNSNKCSLVEILTRQTQGVTISIVTDNSENMKDRIGITPQRTQAEKEKIYRDIEKAESKKTDEEKAEKFHHFCCRAIREIFQRVLPIYSEVKLKGDSSNVSYVSFLTCGCFKTSFSANIELFPLLPIHFLDGPVKDYSKTPPKSMTPSDRHFESQHDCKTLEVVIMLRPLLRKIQGTVPLTNEKFSMILSQDLSAKFARENIQDNLGESSEMVATMRSIESFHLGEGAELVLPSYRVIPKMLTGRAQHAIPKPFVQPSTLPQHTSTLPSLIEEGSDTLRDDEVSHHSPSPIAKAAHSPRDVAGHHPFMHTDSSSQALLQLPRIIAGNRLSQAQAGGPSSFQPSQGAFMPTFAAEQAVGEAQPSSKKQSTLRQGTVLFTSVPDKIPSDRILSLPSQRVLIKKGGNGSIFSENVNGLALAVKKTAYRSKEYAIVTKIRHKNIIPLLAYVWGEEHEESKRRYYTYHFLPRLSGDLARLVTDKEELSLYKLHSSHRNNPRIMGVAVGNVKYILSQVLEGLNYLHESHKCIHRDVKASNILIKFFCGCSNPVECSCDVKYQVSVGACIAEWVNL